MVSDFSTQYADLSDEELLRIASDRASLRDEAVFALDAEMQKRKLNNSDVAKQQRIVERSIRKESRRRRRKVVGSRRSWRSSAQDWAVVLCAAICIGLISIAYQKLPPQYHFSSDWEETAEYVMWASVSIIAISSFLWRRIGFWISMITSTAIHAVVVHAWVIKAGTLSGRGDRSNRLAIMLGFALFVVVYGCGFFLRRKFYGEEETVF